MFSLASASSSKEVDPFVLRDVGCLSVLDCSHDSSRHEIDSVEGIHQERIWPASAHYLGFPHAIGSLLETWEKPTGRAGHPITLSHLLVFVLCFV